MPKKFKPKSDYSRRGGQSALLRDLEEHNLKEYGTKSPYKKSITEALGIKKKKKKSDKLKTNKK